MGATAVHLDRRGPLISACTAAPVPVAADASAARDAARWGATLGLHLEVVRGCRLALMALARDFPLAMAVRARLLSLAHRYVREPHPAQLPQDGWLKAPCRTELLAARAQKALLQQALRAPPSVPDDEWESRRAQSLRVQQPSQPEAPPPVQEPMP
jgi:hypothetical protein